MKQLHERELKLIETYHKIDAERLNAYIERERERHVSSREKAELM